MTLIKTGAGATKVDGHNTYSGGTYILQGRLQLSGVEIGSNGTTGGVAAANNDGFGTGPVYIFPGAYAYLFGAAYSSSTANPIANTFYISGNGDVREALGAIRLPSNRIDLTGPASGPTAGVAITLIGNSRIGGSTSAAGNTITLARANLISGQITDNGAGYGLDFGSGNTGLDTNVTVSNPNNNYHGNTSLVSPGTGTNTIVHLGASNVIPDGVGFGNLVFGSSSATDASPLLLDMNGFNETVNGLSSVSNVTGAMSIENDAISTTSTLTIGNNDQSGTFAGILNDNNGTGGTLALTKIGNGVETLSAGSHNYTGQTNINGGTLAINGNLNTASAVFVNTSTASAGTLAGTGSMGSVTLAAAVSGHKAVINPGSAGAGTSGTLTMQNLTVGTGSDLQFDLGGTSDQINVGGGTVAFGGATTITPSVSATGTYTVLTAGTITGAEPTLVTANDTRLNVAYDGSSYNGTSGNNIIIDVTGTAANLTWAGTGSDPNLVSSDGTTWDVNHTPNWSSTAATHPDLFFNGDSVTFDNTGLAHNAISIFTNVKPGAITVANTSGEYDFNGSGSIQGTALLTKNNNGTLTINTSNSFSGGTTLNAGLLNVNNNNALGTGPIMINGGTLGNTSTSPVTVAGSLPQTWNADFGFAGPYNLDLGAGPVTLSGLINGANRTITVNGGILTVDGIITDSSNNNGLVVTGTGALALTGTNAYNGSTTINSGATLMIGNVNATGSNAGATVTIQNGATLDLGAFPGANAGTAGAGNTQAFVVSGSGVGGLGAIINSSNNAQQNALSDSVTMTGNTTVGGAGRFDFRYSNATPTSVNFDLGTHTLTKTGTNQVSLVNAYVGVGNIVVNQGTLSIEAGSVVPNNNDGTSITYNAGTTAAFYENTTDGTNSYVQRPMFFNGGVTVSDASAAATTATIGSNMTLQGNVTFTGGAASTLTLQGPMHESGGSYSVTKTGVSTLALTASNNYSGGTNFNGGLINFNNLNNLGALVRSHSPAVVCSTPTPVRISTIFRCAR